MAAGLWGLRAKVAQDLACLGDVVALPIAPLLLCLLRERPLSSLTQACCNSLAIPPTVDSPGVALAGRVLMPPLLRPCCIWQG
ncbi:MULTISPECIES: hypothetical protein [Aeromonas]|uniref:hypothetical protein n=1 Tax=Aeromonas TaxID=642 RepID=UPI001CCE6E9B|nr:MULTISPECIES: hypothetical protein [Aeromonas]MCS3459744.1 hypothetical protein [Aeromonas sp. BIGb0445]UBO74996.1 hypothetical protein KYK33_05450 [Aeromonas rivuli]